MTTVDFLIIGSGIAGLSAACELAEHGSVAILTKGAIKESNTHYAQGGIAVALHEDDAPIKHLEDTLQAGAGLCDVDRVKILVGEGPSCVQQLIGLGANFDRDDNGLSYGKEAAHCQRRILHAGDQTGREIEKTLGRYLLQHPNVTFYPQTSVIELIVSGDRCVGCWVSCDGQIASFFAQATLLATGGCGQLYMRNTNPPLATGDGVSLAYQVGCEVQDMEFVQFHPTTLHVGDKKPISLFLISETVRGEGALLRNSRGDRFMPDYHPLAELAPRDIVARSIFYEMRATQSDHVFLDLSAMTVSVSERFPTITSRCLDAKINVETDFVPVAPAAHYMIGGVRTNEFGRTAVDGLYAAGEVAATGLHGANRLASNSLLEGLVFGKRAAQDMSHHAKGIPTMVTQHAPTQRGVLPKRNELYMAKQTIRQLMWDDVGIERHARGLHRVQQQLENLSWVSDTCTVDPAILEIKHMLCLAKLCTAFALERSESRGAHYRSDYPSPSDDPYHLVTSLHDKKFTRLSVSVPIQTSV